VEATGWPGLDGRTPGENGFQGPAPGHGDDGRARLDLRLVPAALGAWACTLLGLWVGWPAAAVAALAGAVLVVIGGLAGRREGMPTSGFVGRRVVTATGGLAGRGVAPATGGLAGRGVVAATGGLADRQVIARHGGRGSMHRLAAGSLALGAALLASGAITAALAHRNAEHPVRRAAESGAAATLNVRLTGDPRPLHSAGYGDQRAGVRRVIIDAELRDAVVAGQRWTGAGRVMLLADAEDWSALLPGQRLTAEGLLAPPLHRDLTVAALRVRGPPKNVGPPPWWQRAAGDVRAQLRDAARVLPEQPAGLLPSLVVGDTSRLPPEVTEEFRVAGLSHLTAVSGTNVAIVCGTVLGLLRLLRVGPRASAWLTALALVGFVVLARPSPSVLRAAVMGGVALLALLVGRRRSALPALSVAVLALLLIDPGLGVEPGFALSVLATGGLVLLAPGWAAALRSRRVPAGVAEAIAVPAAAHTVTAPVVAALSGHVSLVAVAANLLAAPAVAPATVLGVLAAAAAPIHDGAAELVVRLAGPAVQWLVAVGDRSAAVPGATVGWPGGAGGGLLLAAVIVVLIGLLRLRRLRTLVAAGCAGALLVLVPTRLAPLGWPVDGWVMVACDVGQGDALVLATGHDGRAVVVDAGPEAGPVDACLDRLGIRQVPLVVLSHLHADHAGGLAGVLAGRSVGAVAVGPLREPAWAFDDVRRLAGKAAVPVVALGAGQRLQWPAVTIEVLAPVRAPPLIDGDDGTLVNDASLVLRADTAAGRILLTGDIELAGQADLLASGVDLGADVLKVPHHGSRYSSPQFLAAVRPRLAVVSVGAGNRYRHPSGDIVGSLTAAGVRVVRTDEHGDIAVAGSRVRPTVVTRGHGSEGGGRQ
jgi:competence protein ComEC